MEDTWSGRELEGRISMDLADSSLRVCTVAGLGILFEGYDQGVMSGVNISPSYIVRLQLP